MVNFRRFMVVMLLFLLIITVNAVYAGSTTSISNDTLTFNYGSHYLKMVSKLDNVALKTSNLIDKEVIGNGNWKLKYTFDAKSKGTSSTYSVILSSDESLVIGNWSVYSKHIVYEYLTEINKGWKIMPKQIDKNTVSVDFDVKASDGITSIDPFIFTTGDALYSPNIALYPNDNLVIFYRNLTGNLLTFANVTSGWTSTRMLNASSGNPIEGTYTWNYPYVSDNYSMLFFGFQDNALSDNYANYSGNGSYAYDIQNMTTSSPDFAIDAKEWNNDLWITYCYDKTRVINLTGMSYNNLGNNHTSEERNIMQVRNNGNLTIYTYDMGATNLNIKETHISYDNEVWSETTNVTQVVGKVYDVVSEIYQGTDYIFYSLGSKVYYMKNTSIGWAAPISIFNDTLINKLYVVDYMDSMYLMMFSVNSTTDAINFSLWQIGFNGSAIGVPLRISNDTGFATTIGITPSRTYAFNKTAGEFYIAVGVNSGAGDNIYVMSATLNFIVMPTIEVPSPSAAPIKMFPFIMVFISMIFFFVSTKLKGEWKNIGFLFMFIGLIFLILAASMVGVLAPTSVSAMGFDMMWLLIIVLLIVILFFVMIFMKNIIIAMRGRSG